jgi:hypothetical protein
MRPGRYRVTTEIRAQADASVPESTPLFTFEVLSGPRLRALRSVTAKDRRDGALDLEFEVHEGEGDNALPIEFRVGSRGVAGGVVCSVKAERMGDPVRDAPSLDIAAGDLDWLPFLQLGPAGQWSDTGVAIVAGQRGYVAYGPYWTMPPGRYRVTIDLHIGVDAGVPHATPLLVLEAMSGPRLRGFRTVTADWRGDARLDFDFEIHEGEADEVPPIEIRLGSTGAAGGAVRSIVPQRIGDPVQDSPWVDLATGDLDWLAAMQLGRAGDWGDEGVVIVPGQPGFVVYGPYWIMRRGRYRLTAKFRSNVDAGIRDSTPLFTIEVLSGSRLRAMRSVTAKHRGEAALELDFEVHEDEAERALPIEFRIGSSGLAGGTVLALMPRRIGDPRHETEWFDPGSGDLDWLSVMQLAPAGEWSDSGVDVTAGQRGFVVYGPYVTLQPGRYRLTTRMQADVVDGVAGTTPLFTFEVVSGHRLRGFRTVTAADGGESTVELEFEVHEGEAAGPLPIELRIGSTGVAGGAIHSVTPQRIGEPIQETPWIEVAISERAVGHGRARAVWGVLAGDREVPAALSLVYGAVRKYPERVREKVRGIVGRFDRNR